MEYFLWVVAFVAAVGMHGYRATNVPYLGIGWGFGIIATPSLREYIVGVETNIILYICPHMSHHALYQDKKTPREIHRRTGDVTR